MDSVKVCWCGLHLLLKSFCIALEQGSDCKWHIFSKHCLNLCSKGLEHGQTHFVREDKALLLIVITSHSYTKIIAQLETVKWSANSLQSMPQPSPTSWTWITNKPELATSVTMTSSNLTKTLILLKHNAKPHQHGPFQIKHAGSNPFLHPQKVAKGYNDLLLHSDSITHQTWVNEIFVFVICLQHM